MSGLSIHRLSAEVAGTEPGVRVRVDRLLRRLADGALDERRAGWHGLSGHWCVRRLRLLVVLDGTEPDTSVLSRWADAIAASVRELVPDGSRVVHYPNLACAVHELVESLARPDAERGWAWRQLGLLDERDPDPSREPGPALVAVARREPSLVLASLGRAARAGRLRALDGVLGETGWVALARVIEAGGVPWRQDAVPPDAEGGNDRVGGELAALVDGGVPHVAAQVRARAAAVLADSELAQGILASGIVPSATRIEAWAALCVAAVDPRGAALRPAVAGLLQERLRPPVAPVRPHDGGTSAPGLRRLHVEAEPDSTGLPAPARPTSVARALEPDARADAGTREPSPAGRDAATRRDPTVTEPPGTTVPDARPGSSVPTAGRVTRDDDDAIRDEGTTTEWAGLLFLLNTAHLAGVPESLEDDVRLAARSLRWSLHQLAQRLVPVSPTDPAALAFAGLAAARDPEHGGRTRLPSGDPPSDAEDMALAEHAGRWGEDTRTLLRGSSAAGGGGGRVPTLWSVARRPGRLVSDPGWLEVHLDLDTVDVHVRRAGLDVDPGWVPWLGTVVRFRYV